MFDAETFLKHWNYGYVVESTKMYPEEVRDLVLRARLDAIRKSMEKMQRFRVKNLQGEKEERHADGFNESLDSPPPYADELETIKCLIESYPEKIEFDSRQVAWLQEHIVQSVDQCKGLNESILKVCFEAGRTLMRRMEIAQQNGDMDYLKKLKADKELVEKSTEKCEEELIFIENVQANIPYPAESIVDEESGFSIIRRLQDAHSALERLSNTVYKPLYNDILSLESSLK